MLCLDDEFKEPRGDDDIVGDDDGPGWDVDDEDLDLPDLVSECNVSRDVDIKLNLLSFSYNFFALASLNIFVL